MRGKSVKIRLSLRRQCRRFRRAAYRSTVSAAFRSQRDSPGSSAQKDECFKDRMSRSAAPLSFKCKNSVRFTTHLFFQFLWHKLAGKNWRNSTESSIHQKHKKLVTGKKVLHKEKKKIYIYILFSLLSILSPTSTQVTFRPTVYSCETSKNLHRTEIYKEHTAARVLTWDTADKNNVLIHYFKNSFVSWTFKHLHFSKLIYASRT